MPSDITARSTIRVRIEELDKMIESLNDAVAELSGIIDPILLPQDDEGAEKSGLTGTCPPHASELQIDLERLNSRLNKVRNYIHELNTRIDL